ncbi:hypothetical protein K504DRAFT_505316 [Pleomassaria siparia CBS 279.74]|uniref:Fatty acid desaturase domain-containing protein n=1 Tax=Pleomassaria siparia CBS 279.74 TaxID=1314801 RepID=A0A6G1K0I3_9PLEO|nr:hypothetical protein K504DRAFT_505316 [Pleomassaria siparia CBS 279.74]
MTLNYVSHPAEIVGSGEVKGVQKMVTIDDLKRAIPPCCFKPSYVKSLFFLFRDILVIGAFGAAAWFYIPEIQYAPARYAVWIFYGNMQGLASTGFWLLGHECGHGSFSPSKLLNNTLGWIVHSSLMISYFAWQSTHRLHHIYTNNLATSGLTHVPDQQHLFPRIPHYYTKEATQAIQPLLGAQYHEDRGNFNAAMWESFNKCQWIKADDVEDENQRAYWLKAGPIPPPESDMKKRAWI